MKVEIHETKVLSKLFDNYLENRYSEDDSIDIVEEKEELWKTSSYKFFNTLKDETLDNEIENNPEFEILWNELKEEMQSKINEEVLDILFTPALDLIVVIIGE